jgi:hypothetical protein
MMRKYMGFVALVIAGVIGLFIFISEGGPDESKALRRVETILQGITSQDGGNTTEGDEEAAICMWFMGRVRIHDQDLFDDAAEVFERWKRKGGLGLYIKEYTIGEARQQGKSVIVSGTIDGNPFEIEIPEKGPIAWKKPPFNDEK